MEINVPGPTMQYEVQQSVSVCNTRLSGELSVQRLHRPGATPNGFISSVSLSKRAGVISCADELHSHYACPGCAPSIHASRLPPETQTCDFVLNTWFNTFLWVHVMQRRPTNSLVRLIHTQATNYTLCLHTYFSLSEHNAKWRREYECTRSRRGVGRQSRAQGEKKKKSFQCVVKGIKIIVRKIEGNKINHIFRISCPTRATAGAKECRERNFLPIGNVFPADIIALHWFSLYDINDI